MSELRYPLRVVFEGGSDGDGLPLDTYEVHGPFQQPGELWRWANREGYLSSYRGWREDVNAVIRKHAALGSKAIKMALDEWAMHDLEQYDYVDDTRAHVLQGDAAWRDWQREELTDEHVHYPVPEGWHAVGPVCTCGCEDWPCCGHTDDYAFVP